MANPMDPVLSPHTSRERQPALYDSPLELHENFVQKADLLQLTEEVHSPLCLLQGGVDVRRPDQPRRDDGNQKFEAVD